MALTISETLQGLPFVEGMKPSQVEKLAAMAREVGFTKDQLIFREGDTQRKFYIVLSGKVALEMTTANGIYRILTIQEGGELGWSFFGSGTRRRFRARALDRVRALEFDGSELEKACQEDPEFGYRLTKRILRVVSSRLEAMRIHFIDMYSPQTSY